MHERTQRAVARLLFVFCCAVPTLFTMAATLTTWTPWYHHRTLAKIESELSLETGLIIEIEDFRRMTPASLRLSRLRILHPESREEVARVREVQWVRRSTEVSLLLHQPEVQSGQLEGLWKLVHDRFLCRPKHTSLPTRLAANDLTVHSRSGSMTLRDCDAWIETDPKGVSASIQCVPAVSRSDVPILISVRRDRSESQPSTRWTLDTQGITLPCSAVAEYLPALDRLGSEATFRGLFRWTQTGNAWSIDLGGSRFEEISLDRLFEHHAHRLSGVATVQLDRCRVEPGKRRSDIAGSLRANDGFIGMSLLRSAEANLGFGIRLPESWSTSNQDVPYDHLALGFNVNNTQLKLDGICRAEPGFQAYPAGVVMLLNGYPIVSSGSETIESLRAIAAIAPAYSVPVPLSKQTSWLTNVFVPPSRALPSDDPLPPRIRSAGTWQGSDPITQPR